MHLALDAVAPLAASADLLGRPTVLTVLWGLVQLGVVAALTLGVSWLMVLLWRERMATRLARQFPDQADQVRKAVRSAPLRLRERAPKDPLARTHHVVVPPFGDGRPGESFWTAGPARRSPFEPARDGFRQDVSVLLAPGVHMLVQCRGRVGAAVEGQVVLPAHERAQATLDHAGDEGTLPVPGPVDRVTNPGGEWWRVTLAYRTGYMLTDTHTDHEGWGFVVGVLSTGNHPRAVELVDHVLATWRWLPAQPADGESTRSA